MKNKTVENFINAALPIIKNKFSPSKVLIFGSTVTGQATEYSDIDILIISNYFKGISFIKRMPIVLKAVRFEKHIDALCYTEDEFERIKTNSFIISDALENSIAI